MNGNITKRGKDSWRIRVFTGYNEQGKQQFISRTVRGLKRDAQEAARKIIEELRKGTYRKNNKLTLAQYMQEYLDTTGSLTLSPRTLHRYAEIVQKHLIPNLGDVELQKLTADEIRAYYAEAIRSGRRDGKGGLSKRTVLQHHHVLHKILEQALEDDVIASSPATKRLAPKLEADCKMHVITPEQAEELLATASTCKYLDCIKFALQTGMRRGEIVGTKWADLDLQGQRLSISRSITEVKGEIFEKTTKTKSGRRSIDLMDTTISLLNGIRAEQDKNRLFLGDAYNNNDYVFSEANGDCLHPESVTKSFMHYADKANLDLTFHDLRHCHASWLLAAGVHPKIVSERLGHSSVQITLDLYSHLLPTIQAAGIAKLQDMLGDYKSFANVA